MSPSLVEMQWVSEDVIRARKEGSLTQAVACSVTFRVTKQMLGNVSRLGLSTKSIFRNQGRLSESVGFFLCEQRGR